MPQNTHEEKRHKPPKKDGGETRDPTEEEGRGSEGKNRGSSGDGY